MERKTESFRIFIDCPAVWKTANRHQIIRGWCFATDGRPIIAIRLRTPDMILAGAIGLPRPDVKAAMPEAPNENTGFEIRGTLPPGRSSVSLEVRVADGTWHKLISHTVKVRRQFIPFWLGGGTVNELIAFQLPAHMTHRARLVAAEKFPMPTDRPRPKLSIVTPSFNQAHFLPETMRSVLSQAVAVDYVVQDGGSSDGSVGIMRGFAEEEQGAGNKEREIQSVNDRDRMSGASTVRNERSSCSLLPSPNRPRLLNCTSDPDDGQADAIAKGFAKTSGGPEDIMAWINSDDFYLPGALGFVADYFARHPEVDVIYGHRILVDENSLEIGRWFLPKHDPEVLRMNDFVPQETLFWRRRIWDKVGGIDTSFRFAMDWDLLLRFQAAGAKIVRVPYFLACFRIHPAQKTSAQIHSVGQQEIDRLRERTFGRRISPEELESNPRLIRYLRKSAFIEFLWQLGIRAR